jgi:ABC-2 type transport system permease protein
VRTHILRTLRWSVWLGWQIESNWTDPLLFAVYVVAKPLTGSLLLVFMFWAAWSATQGAVRPAMLAFSYAGNALFMLVGAIGFGMSGALIADREHYGMLKYIRVSPVGLQSYLVGRGLAGGAQGALGALLTLTAGLLLPLGLRETMARGPIAWGWLVLYLLLGLILLLALGLMLAGAVLNMARHGMFLSEGVGSALYLLSGAIFPLDVLPWWLGNVGRLLPTTYWLEGMRRALLGPEAAQSTLADWSFADLALALAGSTLALVILSQVVFRWGERRASRLGRFDQTTGY